MNQCLRFVEVVEEEEACSDKRQNDGEVVRDEIVVEGHISDLCRGTQVRYTLQKWMLQIWACFKTMRPREKTGDAEG